MEHSPEFHRLVRGKARTRLPGETARSLTEVSAPAPRWPIGWAEARLVVLGGTLAGLIAATMPWPIVRPATDTATPAAAMPTAAAIRFGACHSGGGTNCVVDGDTFWMHGEKIRIADIDTPETHPPKCAEEARLGIAATARLQVLLNAGPVTLEPADRDTDRYGRKLSIVTRDGESLGGMRGWRGGMAACGGAGAAECDEALALTEPL